MGYLTINTASRWLRERGIRPCSRTALYIAIAKRELRATNPAPRVVLIRVADLEAYAKGLQKKAARSA